jgi:uncharacterized protein (DUF305 family)
MKQIIAALLYTAALSLPVAAQHNNHSGHGQPAQTRSPAVAPNPASEAFAAANARMHKDMAIPFTGNADADFARGMIPHHQGAVEMAGIILTFGKDDEVKKLATGIIAAQKTEIAQMQAWLQKNSGVTAGPKAQAIIEAYEEINAAMHKDMDIAFTGNPDVDFISGMIPHHEGAVEMAKVLLRYGNDGELRKLAEDVVRSQSAEIVMMISWLRRNGG